MTNVATAFISADLTLKKAPLSSDVVRTLTLIEDPPRLADTIIPHLKLNLEEQQKLLEAFDPTERLQKILTHLS